MRDDSPDYSEIESDTRSDAKESNIPKWVIPAIWKAFILMEKFMLVTGKAIFVGLAITIAYLSDSERQHRAKRWLLLEGNRLVLASGLIGVVFFGMVLFSLIPNINVSERSFVMGVFPPIIGGLFSFVPIVIAVNQLTISQFVASPDVLREQIESVSDLRMGIEERIPEQSVTPTEPRRFLRTLVQFLSTRASALDRAYSDDLSEEYRRALSGYVDDMLTLTESVKSRLAGEDLHLFEVVLPLMDDDYSSNVNATRRILDKHSHVLSQQTNELLGDLRELLISITVVRQYFKSVYIRQELADLSRLIAYSGISTFVISALVLLLYTGGQPAETSLLADLLVSAAFAVAFSPFAILFSFVIRIAIVARRTAAPGAFTLKRDTLGIDG